EPVLWDDKICGGAVMPFHWGCPSVLPSAPNTLNSSARGGSRMKIAIAIVIAVALLSAAIIATQGYEIISSTGRMSGLVVCDDPTSGDRGPSCRMLSQRSN